MKILVTGSEGFIATNLIERLVSEHDVVGIDKDMGSSTANFEGLDSILKEFGPDIIIHLGANCSSQISLRNPREDFIDNVVGVFNVCEASRLNGNIPIIFNSTMKVYPGEDGLVPPYGQSKLVGEQYLQLYRRLYAVPYIINRPSSVYGPHQDGSEDGGWFTWFIKASVTGEQITLFGDGSQSRDVLYIDDCIDLLVDQIENFDAYEGRSFDFGGGLDNEVSLNQLLETLDYPAVNKSEVLPGDVQRFVCNNQKVSEVNGWYPKTSWIVGLEKTKTWLEQSLLYPTT